MKKQNILIIALLAFAAVLIYLLYRKWSKPAPAEHTLNWISEYDAAINAGYSDAEATRMANETYGI